MNNVNFRHFQTEKRGAITVASRFGDHNVQGDGKLFEMGVSFCSPRETHFDKKRGRLVAEGRLTAHRNGYAALELQPQIATPLGFLIHYTLSRITGPGWFNQFLLNMFNTNLMDQHAMRYAVHVVFKDAKNIENVDVVALRFKSLRKHWLVYSRGALSDCAVPRVEEKQGGSSVVTEEAKDMSVKLGEALVHLERAYPFESGD